MPEFLALNEHPIEQAALRHLVALKEPLLDSALYTLQLMAAVWDRDELEYGDVEQAPLLPDQVNCMIGWDQDVARLLLFGDEEPSVGSLDDFANDSPQEAASTLFNLLHWGMLELVPGYSITPF